MTEVRHGVRSSYIHRGCRCDECRAAASAYAKTRQVRRRANLEVVAGVQVTTADVEHGCISTYVNWQCRCDDCRGVWAAYQRAYRRSAKTVASGHASDAP